MRAPPGVGRPGLPVLRGGGACHSKETGTGAGLRGSVQTRQAGLQSSKSLWSWGGGGWHFPEGLLGEAGRAWPTYVPGRAQAGLGGGIWETWLRLEAGVGALLTSSSSVFSGPFSFSAGLSPSFILFPSLPWSPPSSPLSRS